MTEISEILAERGGTHGDYSEQAACSQALKSIAVQSANWNSMSPMQKESVELILMKVSRILTGNANHKDHWDDVGGYSKLVSDRL